MFYIIYVLDAEWSVQTHWNTPDTQKYTILKSVFNILLNPDPQFTVDYIKTRK